MWKSSGAIVVCALMLLLAGQQGSRSQMTEGRRVIGMERGISVSGAGEVQAAPDIVYVTLGVRTRTSQAARAAADNAAAISRVIQAVRQLGVPEADVETAQYTLQPVFEYPPSAAPRLTGYEATNLVRVTVRDLSKVGQVIDAAVGAGANVVQDVVFALKNESEVRAQALAKAIEDGRAKAEVMAQALGVRLGFLVSASEAAAPIVTPMLGRAEAFPSAPTPISPRQIEVRATVNLLYDVMPQ